MTLDHLIEQRIEELAQQKFKRRWAKWEEDRKIEDAEARAARERWDVERHAEAGHTVTFEALGHKIEIKGAGPFTVRMKQTDEITDYLLKQAFKNGELKAV